MTWTVGQEMSSTGTSGAEDDGRPRRVVVLGVTGSGKTTAGRRVAGILGAKHIELDALWWGPNWTPSEPEDFRPRLTTAIDGVDRWVTDGGYASHVWDITWVRADVALWLDYPLALIMARLLRRTSRRLVTGERLWHDNKESFRAQFMSRESLFLWAKQSHAKYRQSYPEYFTRQELRHVKLVRCSSPGKTEAWLQSLAASQ